MKLLALSFSYRSASLSFREKVAFAPVAKQSEAYALWQALYPAAELVLISTCNRVELYAAANHGEDLNPDLLRQFVGLFADVTHEEIVRNGVLLEGLQAARHLYRVTSGMDSIAVGESQIVAQVKSSYDGAVRYGTAGKVTHRLFQSALKVSAEVRTKTLISSGRISVASVAINDCAKKSLGSLRGKQVLIIGAGEMAEEALRYLASEQVESPEVMSRTFDKAKSLATRFGGVAFPMSELTNRLQYADVVIAATSSPIPILNRKAMEGIRPRQPRKPVCVVDLAAPRNVDSDVRLCPAVTLFDLDDLEATVRRNGDLRKTQIAHGEDIIDTRLADWQRYLDSLTVATLVSQTHNDAKAIAASELQALLRKSLDFDELQTAAVERMVSRIVNKVLHSPLKAFKSEATGVTRSATTNRQSLASDGGVRFTT